MPTREQLQVGAGDQLLDAPVNLVGLPAVFPARCYNELTDARRLATGAAARPQQAQLDIGAGPIAESEAEVACAQRMQVGASVGLRPSESDAFIGEVPG